MARHLFATWPAEATVGPREGGVLTAVAEQNPLNYKYQNDHGNLARRNESSSGRAFERGSRSTFDTTWRGIFWQSCPQKRKYVLGREGRFSSEAAGALLTPHGEAFVWQPVPQKRQHVLMREGRFSSEAVGAPLTPHGEAFFGNLARRNESSSSGGRAGFRARQQEHL